MENEPTPETREQISFWANKIVDYITTAIFEGRSGFDAVWDTCDDDTCDDITQELESVVTEGIYKLLGWPWAGGRLGATTDGK